MSEFDLAGQIFEWLVANFSPREILVVVLVLALIAAMFANVLEKRQTQVANDPVKPDEPPSPVEDSGAKTQEPVQHEPGQSDPCRRCYIKLYGELARGVADIDTIKREIPDFREFMSRQIDIANDQLRQTNVVTGQMSVEISVSIDSMRARMDDLHGDIERVLQGQERDKLWAQTQVRGLYGHLDRLADIIQGRKPSTDADAG